LGGGVSKTASYVKKKAGVTLQAGRYSYEKGKKRPLVLAKTLPRESKQEGAQDKK